MKILKIALSCVIVISLFTGCMEDKSKNQQNSSLLNSQQSSTISSVKDDISSPPESSEDTSSKESESSGSSSNESSEKESSSGESSQESAKETMKPEDNVKTQQNITSSGSGIVYENDGSSRPQVKNPGIDYNSLSNQAITWGPGPNVDEDGRPTAPVDLQEKYKDLGAYFIAPNSKNVYLTFDQGYENGFTPAILDTLKEKNVSAVFFLTMDYATKNHDLIQRMVDEGHILANHTNKHPNMTTISSERCIEEIMSLHDYIKENFNYDMWLFRPPEGAFSEKSLGVTYSQNYLSIFWSFAYKDWEVDNQPDPAYALDRMTSQLHGGAIYLLHAVSETNTKVLGSFIDNARQEGYTFSRFDLKDPSTVQ